MRRFGVLGLGVFACFLAGCPSGDSDPDGGAEGGDGDGCEVGSESCPCTSGGACDDGLTCVSSVCVDLGGLGGTGGGSGGSGGTGGGGVAPSGDASAALNASFILPNEGDPLMDPETDESVVLDALPSETQALMPGSMINVSLPFTSSSGNVIGAGIRFGDTGPIRTVMIPGAQNQSGGTLDFDVMIPPSVCNDLANICHDIRCYEFAVTDVGQVSRENIRDIALMCGDCNEPNCQDLLPPGSCGVECTTADECDPGETCSMGLCVGEGALRFTLTWSVDADYDLHVITPTGTELSYITRSGDGGMLDRDDTTGGSGAVENIYFDTSAPAGEYTYYVDNFSGVAGSFTLQVFKDGSLVASQAASLPAESGGDSERYTISYP